MSYIMGFVTPIRTDGRDAFVDHAQKAAALLREFGATRVVDAWGVDVPTGQVTDFARAVALRDGETVGFGWVEFADKATADACMEQLMRDPRMDALGELPFDGKRMIFGGFAVVSDS